MLVKLHVQGADNASDHEIHRQGVLLAERSGPDGKLLNKALDRKHRVFISRFSEASTAEELGNKWDEAVARGDIPGAYWSILTHPAANDALIARVFGEVHMLSHLVGSANRADIRRLRELEQQNVALMDKVERQQRQIRDAIVARDKIIASLQASLAAALSSPRAEQVASETCQQETAALPQDVRTALEERLAIATVRLDRQRRKNKELGDDLERQTRLRIDAERREAEVLSELAATEAELVALRAENAADRKGGTDLDGRAVLYVGGITHHVATLRAAAERVGAQFLHHDGGTSERNGLIASLISRADIIMFPVDCVSHDAVTSIKKTCRQLGKRYRPLRSSGMSSFLLGLRELAEAEVSRDRTGNRR